MVRTFVVGSLAPLTCMLLLSSAAWAQQASGIAGVAKDRSGAVLPGVTVEASSPALIEKVRTVVTDGEGRYNIVDLRPGTYDVAFSLVGFSTVKREGIILTAGFTATVNADLEVGAVQETVTVSTASPLVDTQNVRQQNVVSKDLLDTLPTSNKHFTTLAALTPGMTVAVLDVAGVYQAVGTFHGKAGTRLQFDGMGVQHAGGAAIGYSINAATVEEMTVQTSGISAEGNADGAVMNMIPKEGSNTFTGTLFGLYSNDKLQSDNLTDELRGRGLTSVNKSLKIYDVTVTFGGPIKKDRLWFFAAPREWGNGIQMPGIFWNKTQGTPFYTPDLDRPGDRYQWFESFPVRLTWQATRKNKFNVFADVQDACICRSSIFGTAPEAIYGYHFRPQGLYQVAWTSPVTSKLLFEAGVGVVLTNYPGYRQPGVTVNDISILEQSTGFRYNARDSYNDPQQNDRHTQRFSVSYVTGSHAFKAGVQNEQAISATGARVNGNMSYTFNQGVPASLTQFATPYLLEARTRADVGIFFQDQWAIKHLTLNYGLRFEYLNGYNPAQHVPATPNGWVPERSFAAVADVPSWTDLDPRLGAAYDLFGDGRTALKVSLGRYVALTGNGITTSNNPITTSVTSVNRTWTDANGNYVPDCDLGNRASNGECGAMSDQNFGGLRSNSQWADDAIRGFSTRDYNWDMSTEVQHQLTPKVALTAGYYRSWYGNFRTTDNLSVTAADYSTYCVTAPVDARLPGGGGYQVCGLYDVSPSKFGQVNSLVTQASNYGKQTLVNNFFNVRLNTRFGQGILFGGGVDTGRSVADNCFVVDSPQQLLNCHIVTPFKALTQIKLNGSYPLPHDFVVSGVFQNLPGPQYLAEYAATTAEILPSLGRNLAACGARVVCAATATVPLIVPQTHFEGRITRLDLRLTKGVSVGPKLRLQANVDVYNVLNASSVLDLTANQGGIGSNAYGTRWRIPTLILEGRIIQFSTRLTF